MYDEIVSVKQLSRLMGVDRSGALRYLKRIGIRPRKRRTPDSGNQLAATITRDEAETVLRMREDGGFVASDAIDRQPSEAGYFYAIQVVPELAPGRIKVGFAANVDDRLQQHRTAAPTAILLRAWRCRRTWEQAAIDSVTRSGCTHIAGEVYNFDDLATLVIQADQFFDAMPDTGATVPLSLHSPLATPGEEDPKEIEAA